MTRPRPPTSCPGTATISAGPRSMAFVSRGTRPTYGGYVGRVPRSEGARRRGPGEPGTVGAERQHERGHQDERAVDDMQRVDDELLLTEDRQRAKRDLQGEQHEQQHRGTTKLGTAAVVEEDVTRGGEDEDGDRRRADAMREMDRDLRVPHRRDRSEERRVG